MRVKSAGNSQVIVSQQHVSASFTPSSGSSEVVDGQTLYYLDITISALTDYTRAIANVSTYQNSASAAYGAAAKLLNNTTLRVYASNSNYARVVKAHIIEFPAGWTVYNRILAMAGGTNDKNVLLSSNTSKKKLIFNGGATAGASVTNPDDIPSIYYQISNDRVYTYRTNGDSPCAASIFIVEPISG